MSQDLPPIPTPPALLWRQVRLRYLPFVVYLAGIGAAALLWTRWVAPPTLVGEIEALRSELRSGQSGALVGLQVDVLQSVAAGQVLGHVQVQDPRLLAATLDVVRAEIDVLRTSTDMNFERLRLDWMSKRVDLIGLQADLVQADATLARVTALHRIKLVTDEEFDQARNTRDSVDLRLKAQTDLIQRLEPELRQVDTAAGRSVPAAVAEGLRAAIRQKEAQLKLVEAQFAPLPLVAPIDGIVTVVYRRAGENVTGGEPILQISSHRTDRIVGFIRQPVALEPKAGMSVEVRTRTFQRQAGVSTIGQVGNQLEAIPPTLLAAMRLPVSVTPTEFGLRVVVPTPPGLAVRPGEQVDLIVRD